MLKLRLSLILFFILFGIGYGVINSKLQEQRAALKKIPLDIKVQYSKDGTPISSESWAIDGTYLGKMKFNPEQIK
ncbi:MAG: hypothetical protein H6677_26400 [Candidatus Obscuribacterales bacterium]|nr:hypothetical protein [Cyanobacteria bacterium HKST-UBA01]MCB9471833.1 hypothetical protein [Candidatus Obscuribacterales bacterium]